MIRPEARQRLQALLAEGAPAAIKCCGMSRACDIEACNAALPDLVGLVVDFPRSHRSVEPARVASLTASLDPRIPAVGVFVDADPGLVADLADAGAIDCAQLHGHEDEAYLAGLRALTDVPVIQAFRARETADVQRAEASTADLVLLDNGQGTGERFDWSLVQDVARPFLLAGGLDPQSLARALETVRPWGVDLSSGLETEGLKDPAKILAAVTAARSATIR